MSGGTWVERGMVTIAKDLFRQARTPLRPRGAFDDERFYRLAVSIVDLLRLLMRRGVSCIVGEKRLQLSDA